MFNIGDRVMCIDDKPRSELYKLMHNFVSVGVLYTVRAINRGINIPGILVEEVRNPKLQFSNGIREPGFANKRFIKIYDENVKIERKEKAKV